MGNRLFRNCALALGMAIALAALLFCLVTYPRLAYGNPSIAADPFGEYPTVDNDNFQLLGTYAGTTGFVGQAINASGNRAYVYFDDGLQILDVSNPAAVQHLGGRDTPKAGISAIERDGGLLFVAVDRASGLGGDYLEILATEPVTGPEVLGTYTPPEVKGNPVTSIHDVDFGSAAPLYVGQSDGIAIINRFGGADSEGNIFASGSYATDVVRNLLVTGDLLVADTNDGVELLTTGFSLSLLGRLETVGPANAVALVGDTLYRATGNGLEVINISDRTEPVLLRTIPQLRNIRSMVGVGALLYTAQLRTGGVRVYFASDPQKLVETGYYQDEDFSAVGLTRWNRVYVTGNHDGMRILQYTGEKPRLQTIATGPGVQLNGADLALGQTEVFTQPFTIRLAHALAGLDLQGKCESVLRVLIAFEAISSEEFDPFEVFVEVLDLSPTLCEPERPPSLRNAAKDGEAVAVEARIDLRLESGGLRLTGGEFALLQNVRTPVAVVTGRGQSSFEISHHAGVTRVRALGGDVTVKPRNVKLEPATLTAGQEVEVTENGVGEVRGRDAIYLPLIVG